MLFFASSALLLIPISSALVRGMPGVNSPMVRRKRMATRGASSTAVSFGNKTAFAFTTPSDGFATYCRTNNSNDASKASLRNEASSAAFFSEGFFESACGSQQKASRHNSDKSAICSSLSGTCPPLSGCCASSFRALAAGACVQMSYKLEPAAPSVPPMESSATSSSLSRPSKVAISFSLSPGKRSGPSSSAVSASSALNLAFFASA
mmetsp:Transcript_151967/g.487816  ORF Transcript_151967/g.487816 Transcript_151967/m.487816 type:complete len:207 (+) Transcript_151967:1495-2115(+)